MNGLLPNAVVAALHFVGAFGVVATVFSEWMLFSRTPTLSEARRIQRCDTAYGIFATIVVIAGLLRVFYFEKGSHFYLSNPIFITKMTLFIMVGILSIYPTIQFIRWRKATRSGAAPAIGDKEHKLIALSLRAEVLCLGLMILAASLMAKGIGLRSG